MSSKTLKLWIKNHRAVLLVALVVLSAFLCLGCSGDPEDAAKGWAEIIKEGKETAQDVKEYVEECPPGDSACIGKAIKEPCEKVFTGK